MIALLLLAAQAGPLPPARPVPLAGATDAAVMAPISATLGALRSGDAATLLANTWPGGGTTRVVDGQAVRTRWADVAAGLRSESPRFDVSMASPAIEIDGDIATVWMRYTLRAEGKPPSCGVDHFDLVRTGGQWRLLNLTFSVQSTGCER